MTVESPTAVFDDPKQARDQRLRKRRLGMSFLSYQATLAVVSLCWLTELVPAHVVIEFFLLSLFINGVFFLFIHFNINLRFKDPSMTSAQMVASLLPPIWVMYFLEVAQARTIFLLIAIVPALYGILALRTRQFLGVAVAYLVLYGGLVLAIWLTRPALIMQKLSIEIIQVLAFALVMGQIAIIGGYISGLRKEVRERNRELRAAMQQIRELAHIDELTGVANRRRLMDVLTSEINRCRRSRSPLSIALLDIDHFKQINDRFGHPAGDAILRRVACSVDERMRDIDCFGRYGGEEFMMILPQTDLKGARVKAERVCQSLRELCCDNIQQGVQISASIGVAQHRDGERTEDTIQRADRALYQAKATGRDRVTDERQLPPSAILKTTSTSNSDSRPQKPTARRQPAVLTPACQCHSKIAASLCGNEISSKSDSI
ncbi:diguanylate cyclase [Marinobacter sp. R17]|uniref:GGDEF domain-containing protein n=1 Tax=Marinobacter sp. R17 TaxID=2484250 RepID=UPI000F4CF38C|nr:diguanylate cyclase [Marinobacter sp. R17]ROU01796.1 diguanylate cyclase [Marinobacter sp. R17]